MGFLINVSLVIVSFFCDAYVQCEARTDITTSSYSYGNTSAPFTKDHPSGETENISSQHVDNISSATTEYSPSLSQQTTTDDQNTSTPPNGHQQSSESTLDTTQTKPSNGENSTDLPHGGYTGVEGSTLTAFSVNRRTPTKTSTDPACTTSTPPQAARTEISRGNTWQPLPPPLPPLILDPYYNYDEEIPSNTWSAEDALLSGLCQHSTKCRPQPPSFSDFSPSSSCPPELDCFPCSCKACSMGTCCPEVMSDITRSSGQNTGCVNSDRIFGIVDCPAEWLDSGVREACRGESGKYTSDEPVSDRRTKMTFRNRHCAECYGVSHYDAWALAVDCQHFQHVYAAESEDELLEKAFETRLNNTCTIHHAAPGDVPTAPCDPGFFPDRVVSSCNVTGSWRERDPEVEDNCARYTALTLRVRQVQGEKPVFQNIFCAECNGLATIPASACPFNVGAFDVTVFGSGPRSRGRSGMEAPRVPPLTLLLGLDDQRRSAPDTRLTPNCSNNAWLDIKGDCQNVTCTAGKILRADNNTCTTALSLIRGLAYDLNIRLLPQDNASRLLTKRQFSRFKTGFRRELKAKAESNTDFYRIKFHVRSEQGPNDTVAVREVRLSGTLWSNRDVLRDDVEENLINALMMWCWNVTVDETRTDQFNVVNTHLLLPLTDFNYTAADTFLGGYANYLRMQLHFSSELPPHLRIPLTSTLTCPFAEFDSSDFQIRSDGINTTDSVQIIMFFGSHNVTLPDAKHIELEADKLRVCLHVLEGLPRPDWDERLRYYEVSAAAPYWQYVLSMTAIPLSIVCLGAVLVVYGLLPALRTQPGLNTMATCLSLLLAQLWLLLASHRVVQGRWCLALGVLLHVAWLSAFCWTSVCSLHMYTAFSCSTTYRADARGKLRRFAWYASFTVLAPFIVVGAVVCVSFLTSGGESIGYSSLTCYLASPELVGYAMIGPLSLILLVNVVLFVLTVRRIRQVTKLKPRSQRDADSGRQHVKICFRLSLLTGATWILSLLAEGLDLDWLRAVSILTNGGQGVLLFLSYVTTRRVLSMLAVRLGCKAAGPRTSTTTATTTTATFNNINAGGSGRDSVTTNNSTKSARALADL